MTKRVAYFIVVLLLFLQNEVHAQLSSKGSYDSIAFSRKLTPLAPSYYAGHLSFFCKQELQLQKVTGTAIFFRLGSKEYVDYLEQKPNATKKF